MSKTYHYSPHDLGATIGADMALETSRGWGKDPLRTPAGILFAVERATEPPAGTDRVSRQLAIRHFGRRRVEMRAEQHEQSAPGVWML